MVGLLNTSGAGSSGAPPESDDRVGDEEGMEPNVSAEEQREYERFVHAGWELIYDGDRIRPTILKLLDEDPSDLKAVLPQTQELENFSPLIALAATAVIVTLQVVHTSAEKPDDAIIFHGGKAILEELAEVIDRSGSAKLSEEDVSQAFRVAADIYREAASAEGMIDENQLKQEFAEITTAEKEGRLGKLLPPFAGVERQLQEQGSEQGQARDAAAPASPAAESQQAEEGQP